MTQAPDSVVITAPPNQPVSIDDLLVTPTGGVQGRLADKLASGGGSSVLVPISASALTTMNSIGVDSGIPAPGAGFKLVSTAAFGQLSGGGTAISGLAGLLIVYDGDTNALLGQNVVNTADSQNLLFAPGGSATSGFDPANKSLRIIGNSDMVVTGPIASAVVNAGGVGWVVGDTAAVAGGTGGVVQIDTIDPTQFSGAITALVQGGNEAITAVVAAAGGPFTIAGDFSAALPATVQFTVSGSTGNDGTYTVVTAVFGAGSTVITVAEGVPDATADGNIFISGVVTVAGDHVAALSGFLTISGSTGNDGLVGGQITLLIGGNTNVFLQTSVAFSSPIADGTLNSTGAAATVSPSVGGSGYSNGTDVAATAVPPSPGFGLTLDTTITPTPDYGTASVWIQYATVAALV